MNVFTDAIHIEIFRRKIYKEKKKIQNKRGGLLVFSCLYAYFRLGQVKLGMGCPAGLKPLTGDRKRLG